MKKIVLLLMALFVVKSYGLNSAQPNNDSSYQEPALEQVKDTVPTPSKVPPVQFTVTATMYMAVVGQCDDTPLITACGYKINPEKASEHKWIAVSRDLLKTFNYGDKVMLTNAGDKNGIYTIADTMNKRFTNKIDILETVGSPLYKLDNVVITKI